MRTCFLRLPGMCTCRMNSSDFPVLPTAVHLRAGRVPSWIDDAGGQQRPRRARRDSSTYPSLHRQQAVFPRGRPARHRLTASQSGRGRGKARSHIGGKIIKYPRALDMRRPRQRMLPHPQNDRCGGPASTSMRNRSSEVCVATPGLRCGSKWSQQHGRPPGTK